MSSICLLVTVLSMDEKTRFLAFFAFELSLGLYFPSIGLLKSQLVDERNRGWIYGLMRVPLNVFVTSVLCTTGEGQVAMQVSDSSLLTNYRRLVPPEPFHTMWRASNMLVDIAVAVVL